MIEKSVSFLERSGKPGGGKGILVTEERTNCLATMLQPRVAYIVSDETVAFEPGIAKREGGESRFVVNKSPTLRANAGDNRPAVAYSIGHDIRSACLLENKTDPLTSTDWKEPPLVAYEGDNEKDD